MEQVLSKYSAEIIQKASRIKLLAFDVDGVLTDGRIIYSEKGDEVKAFNVKDGQIIKHLLAAGIKVGAVTGRSSELVKRRCLELKLDFCEQKVDNKGKVLAGIINKYHLKWGEVCYIGDDIVDMEVVSKTGLGACPIDAMEYIKTRADLISLKRGGEGVVREVGDLILASQGLLDEIIKGYLQQIT